MRSISTNSFSLVRLEKERASIYQMTRCRHIEACSSSDQRSSASDCGQRLLIVFKGLPQSPHATRLDTFESLPLISTQQDWRWGLSKLTLCLDSCDRTVFALHPGQYSSSHARTWAEVFSTRVPGILGSLWRKHFLINSRVDGYLDWDMNRPLVFQPDNAAFGS